MIGAAAIAAIPEQIAHIEQGSGRALTVDTMKTIARDAREDSISPRIRNRVLHLFKGITPMDCDAEIEAVWRHVMDHVRYMRDPTTVAEWITRPTEMDAEIDEGIAAEDCENLALYAATLFSAAGYPILFELQGHDPRNPHKFSHCALRVQNPRTRVWWSFDPVGAQAYGEEAFTLGDSLHKPGAPLELWNIDGEVENMPPGEALHAMAIEALGDTGSSLGDTESTILDVLNSVGKQASNYGPYGQIVGGAIGAGVGIYDAATGHTVGQTIPPVKIAAPPPAAWPINTGFGPYYGGGYGGQAHPAAPAGGMSTGVKVAGGAALMFALAKALL